MRRLLLVLLALLVLGAAPALAQDATPTPTPTEEPDDGILDEDEIPPDTTPELPSPCDDEGADGVYGCAPCGVDSPDADYTYCAASGGGGEPPEAPTPVPAAETRPLSTGHLPYTGGDPLLVALFGMGLLLTGLGLRRAGPSRSG